MIVDRIDAWLLARAGTAAGLAEERLRADQWAVARQALLASLTLFGAQALSALTAPPDLLAPVAADRLADLFVLALIMAVAVRFCWCELDRQSRSSQGAQTALIGESLARGVLLVGVAILSPVLASQAPLLLAGFALFGAHFYFKACTPRPPVGRSRRLAVATR